MIKEAEALVKIANAIECLPLERKLRVLAIAATHHGLYEQAIANLQHARAVSKSTKAVKAKAREVRRG